MNKRLLFIFLLSSFTADLYSQADWKDMLKQQTFSLTENKLNIPLKVLQKIYIPRYAMIANPKEPWNDSCTYSDELVCFRPIWADSLTSPKEMHRVKLNWAASNKDNWVISTTTGCKSGLTYYYLISENKKNVEIKISGRTAFKFEDFKEKYLTDTLLSD